MEKITKEPRIPINQLGWLPSPSIMSNEELNNANTAIETRKQILKKYLDLGFKELSDQTANKILDAIDFHRGDVNDELDYLIIISRINKIRIFVDIRNLENNPHWMWKIISENNFETK